MAVYHRDDPNLLQRAISSIYRNTVLPDATVLVVDGPIPEDIERVVTRSEREHHVTVLRLERNKGLANALNQGLSLVQTEWVARADADDENVHDRFEKQAKAIQLLDGRVDVLGGTILEVDESGSPLAIRDIPLRHSEIVHRLHSRNPFNHMTVVYRAAIVREAGGYPDVHLKEDYALWARLISRGARCANLPDVLVRATAGAGMYRRRGGLRYAKSEWALQAFMVRVGQRSLLSALAFGALRSAIFMLPAITRGRIYRLVLRSRANRADK
jgi:glycosyltransferase involved in cell wall biosynthesis